MHGRERFAKFGQFQLGLSERVLLAVRGAGRGKGERKRRDGGAGESIFAVFVDFLARFKKKV